MCGIAGAVGFGDLKFIEKINHEMAHRGPDDTGFWDDGYAGLGHRRLSIIDTSNAGHQPMCNEDATIWVVYNGEIYNFQDLREELEKRGHLFKSKTDTEVLIHLYEDYGENFLCRLRGMFSFAIWDRRKKRLFAARDRFGIKPFFYHIRDKKFIFASELKALLASGIVEKNIDKQALRDYFTFGSAKAPRTLIENVSQLLPAHYLIFEKSELSVKRYWKISLRGGEYESGDKSDTGRIRAVLDEAVKVRMISDVPLGAFLSGGLDSSSIVALMQKHSSNPVKTFSVAFEESEYDESRFSEKVAARFGTEHRKISLDEKTILSEMPGIFGSMDQPSVDGFNTFVVSKAVKQAGITVALSGLGGDELFIGYSLFKTIPTAFRALSVLNLFPKESRVRLKHCLRKFVKTRGGLKTLSFLSECEGLEDLYYLKRSVFLKEDVDLILTDTDEKGCRKDSLKAHEESDDIINRLSLLDISNYLQDTLLQDTDRMSMANSLEVRVPFMDHILVEELFKIHSSEKIRGGYAKRLLIESMREILPREIYARPKKGFVLPFEYWLRGKLKDYCSERFSAPSLKRIPFINYNKVGCIWKEFLKSPRLYNYASILTIVSFADWYERNMLR